MSTIVRIDSFDEFGERLKEERLRLKLSQKEFAEIGGVKRASQYLYEQSERPPTIEYVARIVAVGVDFQYLLTGERSAKSGGRISVDVDVLDKALALADQISRDDRGRLLDSEIRNTITKEILKAVSDRQYEDIDWERIRQQLVA